MFQAFPFRDPATGIVNARNRWYDPASGTWLSPDPEGYADSANLYAFAGGDPVNYRDPTGLLCETSNASTVGEWTKRCSADVWDVTKEWWAGDTRSGTTHTEDGPRPGESQAQYVTRLTASGMSNQDAALAGEILFKNQQVSAAQRKELAKGFLMAEKPVNVMAALALAPAMAHPVVATLMAAESYRTTGGSLQTVALALPLAGSVARGVTSTSRAASVMFAAPRTVEFTAAEFDVIAEARAVMTSESMAELRAAASTGRSTSINVGGRVIQYEAGYTYSEAMAFFEDGAFVMGPKALVSEQELTKTVLHELYRLRFSRSQQLGVSRALAASETDAAFDFAQRAAKEVSGH